MKGLTTRHSSREQDYILIRFPEVLSNYKNMETYHAIEMISNGQWLDKLIILIGYEQLHLKNSRRKGDKFGKGIAQIFEWIKLL